MVAASTLFVRIVSRFATSCSVKTLRIRASRARLVAKIVVTVAGTFARTHMRPPTAPILVHPFATAKSHTANVMRVSTDAHQLRLPRDVACRRARAAKSASANGRVRRTIAPKSPQNFIRAPNQLAERAPRNSRLHAIQSAKAPWTAIRRVPQRKDVQPRLSSTN